MNYVNATPGAVAAVRFDRAAAEAFLIRRFDVRHGYAVAAFGRDGYVNDAGRYTHKRWSETAYHWPDERDLLLGNVAQEMAAGRVDVYVALSLRTTPKRAKGNAEHHDVLWVDRDADEPLDLAMLADLGAVEVVESGTPGHEHVFVDLADDPGPEERERLCRALAERLGHCDPKFADNDLLRVPGTVNHKTGRPVVVRHRQHGRLDAAVVAKLLHTAPSTGATLPATTVVGPLPAPVVDALARDTGDRSADMHAIAGACLRSGLTHEQTVVAVCQHPGSVDKYGPRLRDEVLRSWVKVVDDAQGELRHSPVPFTPGADDQHPPWLTQALNAERVRRAVRRTVDAEQADAAFIAPPEPLTLAAPDVDDERAEVIADVMREGAIVNVRAAHKAGKTTFGVNVVRSLADAVPLLGRFTVSQSRRVFVLNFEMPPRQYRRWLRQTGIANVHAVAVLDLRGVPNPLASPLGRAWVAERMRRHGADVLVIDPFVRAFAGYAESSNDNDAVARWAQDVEVMLAQAGVSALVLLTHTGRLGEDSRGASFLDGWPDVLVTLARQNGDDTATRYFRAEGRDVEIAEAALSFDPETGLLSLPVGAPSRRAERLDRLVHAVVERVTQTPGMGRGELAERVGGKRTDTEQAITRAVTTGRIEVRSEGTKQAHYLPQPLTAIISGPPEVDRASHHFPPLPGSASFPPLIGGRGTGEAAGQGSGSTEGSGSQGSGPTEGSGSTRRLVAASPSIPEPPRVADLPPLISDEDAAELGYRCDLCPAATSLRFWPPPWTTTRCPAHPPESGEDNP